MAKKNLKSLPKRSPKKSDSDMEKLGQIYAYLVELKGTTGRSRKKRSNNKKSKTSRSNSYKLNENYTGSKSISPLSFDQWVFKPGSLFDL